MFVKQWEEKTTKLNFFSMYFVRTNEEIHLSFKNSQKQRTQALSKISQFEFLVATEKNIFAYKFFLVIKYFRF